MTANQSLMKLVVDSDPKTGVLPALVCGQRQRPASPSPSSRTIVFPPPHLFADLREFDFSPTLSVLTLQIEHQVGRPQRKPSTLFMRFSSSRPFFPSFSRLSTRDWRRFAGCSCFATACPPRYALARVVACAPGGEHSRTGPCARLCNVPSHAMIAPPQMYEHVDELAPALLKSLSDSSDKVVKLDLEVLAEMSSADEEESAERREQADLFFKRWATGLRGKPATCLPSP